nr:DUF6796 family protein [uncultured Blautia sp.]
MKKNEYNPIGIESQLDWPRIRKLLLIGLFAGCMVFIGDWILGYGVKDPTLTGLEGKLSTYTGKTDSTYFWSALLGLFGIVLEGLSYFGIYRLMAEKSPAHAHKLRTGIIGYIAFGACGVHVPCIMIAWLYNYLMQKAPALAYECSLKFAKYFFLPSTILFLIFCVYLIAVQILAFAKGMTPYPKWCWIFNIGFGMVVTMAVATPFRGYHWGNALAAAWISVGNIWQFAGLLIMMKKVKK